MSLPEDWHLHLSELIKHAKDGRDATHNGIRELIANGYCKRTSIRDSRGMFSGYEYTVSDIKEFADNPETENPFTDKPDTDNPETGNLYTENPDVINTDNKQNVSLTDDTNTADGGLFPDELPKTEKVARPRKTSEPLCLFENSRYVDYNVFIQEFKKPEFEELDMVYYYHVVADWSARKGVKRKDWIAETRNFIRSDIEKNKLHRINQMAGLSPDAIAYLKEMSY